MIRLFLAAMAALAGLHAAQADDRNPLTLGAVAMDIPAVMHQRLSPLSRYLSDAIGQSVVVRPSPDLSKAAQFVADGSVDIAYLTPVAYLKAQRAGNVRLLVKTVTKGKDTFKLMIVTRNDSPIRNVRELSGKRFAFGDPAALLQRAVVVNAGVAIEQLGSYRFLGHYDNIALGVLNGDFDAGILKDTSAYQWQKKGLRILHESPGLPPYNIVVNRKMNPSTARAIEKALLALDPKNPAHREVISALDPQYNGFARTSDAEYDVIRRLVAPFEQR